MSQLVDSLNGPEVLTEPELEAIEPVESLVAATPVEPAAEVVARIDEQRRDWARRIRDEQRLPGSLRERLAAAVEEAAFVEADAEPQLTVSQVANVFAEALPTLLALDSPRVLAAHPAGDAFFRAGQLSDDDAARIASEQLARTGYGRPKA